MPQTQTPDFNQFLTVLKGTKPERPVLFEFCIDQAYLRRLTEERGELGSTRKSARKIS